MKKKKNDFEQTIEVLTAEKNANGSKLKHIDAQYNRIKNAIENHSDTIKKIKNEKKSLEEKSIFLFYFFLIFSIF